MFTAQYDIYRVFQHVLTNHSQASNPIFSNNFFNPRKLCIMNLFGHPVSCRNRRDLYLCSICHHPICEEMKEAIASSMGICCPSSPHIRHLSFSGFWLSINVQSTNKDIWQSLHSFWSSSCRHREHTIAYYRGNQTFLSTLYISSN